MTRAKDFTSLIHPLCREHKIVWSHHAAMRLLSRDISKTDAENIMMHGRIIEKYPDDYPFPSCLILGRTASGRPLHMVCSVHEEPQSVHVVTVYEPSVDDWEYDFMTRRK